MQKKKKKGDKKTSRTSWVELDQLYLCESIGWRDTVMGRVRM